LPKERLGGKVGKGQDVKGMGEARAEGRKRRRRKVAMMFVAPHPLRTSNVKWRSQWGSQCSRSEEGSKIPILALAGAGL